MALTVVFYRERERERQRQTNTQTGTKLTAQHTSHTIQNQNVSNKSCSLNAINISCRAAMFCTIKRFQNGHLEFNLGLIQSCIYEQAPHNEQAWRVGKLSSLLTMPLDGTELSGTPQCR